MREVLSHPSFRYLWLAQTTSVIGDRLVIVALALFINDLTGSATDIGIVLGAQTLPFVAFLLIGGVWADRLPRARLMIATDVARAVLHGVLALLIFTGWVEVWHVVVIEALFGTAEAFFRPAYTGLLPRTVPLDQVQQAQALANVSNNVAELSGPALATALVLGLGAGWAFAVDALTFAVSALFLLRVRVADAPPPVSERRTALTELREGFDHFRSRPWLWVTVAVFALIVPLAVAPVYVLGPGVAEDAYDSAALFGIFATLLGVGAVAGGVVALRWRPRRPLLVAFVAFAVWPVAVVLFGLTVPVALLLGVAVVAGVGSALFDVMWHTTMAEQIPPEALSRVSSYDWMGSLILLPVGYLVAGPVAEATSAETVLVTGGVLTAVLLAVGLIPRDTRMLKRIERLALAADGVPQHAARLRHPRRAQRGDATPERRPRNGVDVVEVDDALGRHPILGGSQRELRHEFATRPREGCDDDRSDAIGDGVAREHEDRPAASGRRREPDLTPLHRASRSSPRPVPNQRSRRATAPHWWPATAPTYRRREHPAAPRGDRGGPRAAALSDQRRERQPNAGSPLRRRRAHGSSASSYMEANTYDRRLERTER